RRLLPVDDARERVDGLPVQEDVDPDQVRRLVPDRIVVERGGPAGLGLQLVEEVEDDLREGELVVDLGALGRQVLHVRQLAAAGLAELENGPEGTAPGDYCRG